MTLERGANLEKDGMWHPRQKPFTYVQILRFMHDFWGVHASLSCDEGGKDGDVSG